MWLAAIMLLPFCSIIRVPMKIDGGFIIQTFFYVSLINRLIAARSFLFMGLGWFIGTFSGIYRDKGRSRCVG